MRYSFVALLAVLGGSLLASSASAQCFARKRCRTQAATCAPAAAAAPQTVQYAHAQTTHYAPATPGVQPQPLYTTEATALSYSGDDPAAFLAQLNAFRAQHGRGPLQWDANLAGWGAANSNVASAGRPHAVQCGAGQCWASSRSYVAALQQWMTSPPHRAVLLNAQHSVGVGLGAGGATANAR